MRTEERLAREYVAKNPTCALSYASLGHIIRFALDRRPEIGPEIIDRDDFSITVNIPLPSEFTKKR